MSGKPDFVLDGSYYESDVLVIDAHNKLLEIKSVDAAVSNIKGQKKLAEDYKEIVKLVKKYKELLAQDVKMLKEFYGSVQEFDRESVKAVNNNQVDFSKLNLSKTSNSSNYNSALDDSVVYHTEKRTVEYKGPTVAGGGAAITGTPSEDVVVKNEETKSVGSGGTLTK